MWKRNGLSLVLLALMLLSSLLLDWGAFASRNAQPLVIGALVLLALIVWLRPVPAAPAAAAPATVGYAQLQPVVAQRCVMCHGEALQSKGVRLDSPAELKKNAQTVYQQVVVQKLMPMNNATGLTEEERALFAQWFKAGAPVN